MNERTGDKERRSDPRVTAEHRIHLVASLHGFDADNRRFEATGVTVNVSHRGALVRVNRAVTEGDRCLAHLPEGDRRIGKTLIYCRVLRCRPIAGAYEIAIAFETRLQAISPDPD